MSDDEFFKDGGNGVLELRGNRGGVVKKQNDKWIVVWYSAHWSMEDLGRVYRKLKELNNE